jgi:hypothetical protein
MYDEYERAVGSRSGSGISLLGWLGIAAVLVSLIGATGAFFAYRYVKGQVHEIAEQLRPLGSLAGVGESPMVGAVIAQTLRAAGSSQDLDSDDVRYAITRAFDADDVREAITEAFDADDMREAITRAADASPRMRQTGDQSIEGQFRIRTDEGEFTANLDADDDRGRLVVRRPDGAVIVDLAADEEGGRLVIGADGEEIRIEAGDQARSGHPSWFTELGGSPRDARSIVSGSLGAADFGAVTWETDRDPIEIVERLRERLAEDGWRLEADHDLRDGGASSASTIARLPAEGLTMVIAAGTEDGVTTVVQGWAETRPEG